jgi:hypothetical protein
MMTQEERKEYDKLYYQRNKEKKKLYVRKNKLKINSRRAEKYKNKLANLSEEEKNNIQKIKYQKYKEKIYEYQENHKDELIEYRKNNKEIAQKRSKEYAATHRGKLNYKEAQRRALMRYPKWITEKEKQDIENFYVNCPKGYHVDHIVPLQNKMVTGLHVLANLQYLTSEENIKKGNKFPYYSEEFYKKFISEGEFYGHI